MDSLILKVAATGIAATILAIALKKDNPVFALLITIGATVLIFFMLMPHFSSVINLLNGITQNIDSGSDYILIVLKIIGVAYAAEFASSICADAGESGIASKIELAAKIIIMIISAPIILTLLNQVLSMLP